MNVDQLFKDDDEEVPEEPSVLTSEGRKHKRRKTKEQREKEKALLVLEQDKRLRVKRFVMTALGGTPPGYLSCLVKYVNDGNYRVNVRAIVEQKHGYKYKDKIVHSFYVRSVEDGFYCEKPIPHLYTNHESYIIELEAEEKTEREQLELDHLLNSSTNTNVVLDDEGEKENVTV